MVTLNNESLGRRIARMRLQHGMTQERLADIANVSAQAVSKWENDQSYPDIMLLPLLAKTFDVTVDELLGGTGGTPTRPAAPEPAQTVPSPAAMDEAPEEPATEPIPAVVGVADVAETELEPVIEQEPGAASEPEAEAEPEAETPLEPEVILEPEPEAGVEEPTSHMRIHVVRQGKDVVNLVIPLAAARIVSNVMGYLPDRIIEGVDLRSLTFAAQNAGKGTLIDVNDGSDHVVISLE